MRWWWHLVFWMAICLWMTSVYLYTDVDFFPLLSVNLVRIPFIAMATYGVIHFVVRKQLLQTKPNYWKAVFTFLIIFIGESAVDRVILGNPFLVATLNGEPLFYKFFYLIPIAKNTFLLFSIMGVACAIEFFRRSSAQKQQLAVLNEEKLQTELAFLKSQVNPHFLFNTFNNLYSMAQTRGYEELAKGLLSISQLMRYLTYDSNVPRVSLKKEIELLEAFINLQRLRVEADELSIVFRVTGSVNGQLIAPVLLIPLVENAFKHGHHADEPSWISIVLDIGANELMMEVRNKTVGDSKKDDGMGLHNLKKRLELIYPGSYLLSLDRSDSIFRARLCIPFDEKPLIKNVADDFLHSH